MLRLASSAFWRPQKSQRAHCQFVLGQVVESNFARNMADLQSQDSLRTRCSDTEQFSTYPLQAQERNAQENYDQLIHESQVQPRR